MSRTYAKSDGFPVPFDVRVNGAVLYIELIKVVAVNKRLCNLLLHLYLINHYICAQLITVDICN